MFRQSVKFLLVDQKLVFSRRFMPACVIVGCDLLEAHVQIERGPDPFQRIDSAAIESRVKFTGGDVGHDDAELGKNFSGKARNPHLQALQIVQRVDLLAEPRVLLGSDHAERHGGKEHRADVLALPVIGSGMTHLILTGLDHVEDVERGLVFVGRVDADFHLAAGRDLDYCGHFVDRIAENRKTGPPSLGKCPDNLFRFLFSNLGFLLLIAAGKQQGCP